MHHAYSGSPGAISSLPTMLYLSLGFRFEGAAIIEARAFYGGLELALGVFLAAAAATAAWRKPGLALTAMAFGGIALVRGIAMQHSGLHTRFLLAVLAVEIATCILALLAWRSIKPARDRWL